MYTTKYRLVNISFLVDFRQVKNSDLQYMISKYTAQTSQARSVCMELYATSSALYLYKHLLYQVLKIIWLLNETDTAQLLQRRE